ncbi:hypothetical protein [Catelliglobosispora koreensis]|uniref:hypothetical protein n=1 Tax=Catelliglobosispora koreensis TaxID=129052 RepID=UPI000376B5FC|nr:hypothetical protein [Catelliglobosispora koreensis]
MGQPGGTRRPALALLAVVAAAGVSLLRQTGAGALDTVYAEDGAVFLAASYNSPEAGNFFSPYAGYLHLGPRLITALVSLFPVAWAAWALAVSAAVVTGLLSVLVFFASSRLASLPARLLVSAVVVFVPVGQDELPNSIANLHWPALYALFWVLVWKPRSRWASVVAAGSVLLIAMSDLLVLVFVPLALWLWWRRRNGQSLSVLLALGTGLVAQALTVLLGPGGRELNPEPVKWAPWWAIRAVPTSTLGQRWFPSDVDVRWLALAAVAWILVGLFVFFTFKRTLTDRWQLALLAGAHCVAVYALPVMLSGQATPRYAAAPAMLLVTALVALTVASRPLPPYPLPAQSTGTIPASASALGSASPASASGVASASPPAASASGLGSASGLDPLPAAGSASAASVSAAGVVSASLPGSASLSGAATVGGPGAGLDEGAARSGLSAGAVGDRSTDEHGAKDTAGDAEAEGHRDSLRAWREWARDASKPWWENKDKWAFGLLAGFCAVVWIVNLRVPNERSLGPTWTEQVTKAEQMCQLAQTAQIQLASPGWTMTVDCDEVPSWR